MDNIIHRRFVCVTTSFTVEPKLFDTSFSCISGSHRKVSRRPKDAFRVVGKRVVITKRTVSLLAEIVLVAIFAPSRVFLSCYIGHDGIKFVIAVVTGEPKGLARSFYDFVRQDIILFKIPVLDSRMRSEAFRKTNGTIFFSTNTHPPFLARDLFEAHLKCFCKNISLVDSFEWDNST